MADSIDRSPRDMGKALREGDDSALGELMEALASQGGSVTHAAVALGFKGASSLWRIAYGATPGSQAVRVILAELSRGPGKHPRGDG